MHNKRMLGPFLFSTGRKRVVPGGSALFEKQSVQSGRKSFPFRASTGLKGKSIHCRRSHSISGLKREFLPMQGILLLRTERLIPESDRGKGKMRYKISIHEKNKKTQVQVPS